MGFNSYRMSPFLPVWSILPGLNPVSHTQDCLLFLILCLPSLVPIILCLSDTAFLHLHLAKTIFVSQPMSFAENPSPNFTSRTPLCLRHSQWSFLYSTPTGNRNMAVQENNKKLRFIELASAKKCIRGHMSLIRIAV